MGYPHFAADCHEHHDLVRDLGGPRPTITVLCGSTRFYDEFRLQNLLLTLAGHIVLSIGCDTKSDDVLNLGNGAQRQRVKARLDELHMRKIDVADEVLVLNVASEDHPAGYIGESTRREIDYATRAGKPVRYLVEPGTAANTAA